MEMFYHKIKVIMPIDYSKLNQERIITMTFASCLNNYCEELNCSSAQLAQVSGLSLAVISRYRSGLRTPAANGKQIIMLAQGINKIINDQQVSPFNPADTLPHLQSSLLKVENIQAKLATNLDNLLTALNISTNHLAHYLKYDASFISRVRSGKRKPADPMQFIDDVCNYIIKSLNNSNDLDTIKNLLEIDTLPTDSSKLNNMLKEWLGHHNNNEVSSINHFIKTMDNFNLNEYVTKVHFDELKIPFVPFYKSHAKSYIGIEEIKQGELDFLKATVLSKSTAAVLMCSDMPMEDMSSEDFTKKYLYGLALMLKKGLHLKVIHNLNRPFSEILLGLEGWLPMYMTAQITPYYFKKNKSDIYCHFHNVSGSVALIGECIYNHHDDTVYRLICDDKEVKHYQREADYLLEKASKLMDIYTDKNKKQLLSFLNNDAQLLGERTCILSIPPLNTINESLLKEILNDNHLSQDEQIKIINVFQKEKERIFKILAQNKINVYLSYLTEAEFQEFPLSLALSNYFYEKPLYYTYQQYLKHLTLTETYTQTNQHFVVHLVNKFEIRNIQIFIHNNEWAMFSKVINPAIHFVTTYPKLLLGLDKMKKSLLQQ